MKSQKRTKKIQSKKILETIFITLLILSALTIVPQINGKPVMDKINQKEEIRAMVTNIDLSLNNNTIDDVSILNNLIMSLLSKILGDTIDQELLLNLFNRNTDASMLNTIIDLIKGLLQNENSTNGTPGNPENTILNFIGTLLKSLFSITMTLLKILVNASISLIGGIIRVIGAIVAILLLFLAGTQTVLTLGAVLMLFLGVMSKYGIKALSIIGAPIFALIAAQVSISLGTIFGGISQVVFSLLAILLLFALPLGIGAIIFILLGGSEEPVDVDLNLGNIDLNLDNTGLLYMILSNISNSLKRA